ncbi:MAG: hypothetical protein JSV35_05745, partial [Candidatus Bathyarchaeota archaeon]
QGPYPLLSSVVVVIAIADLMVLTRFRRLHVLCKEYESSGDPDSIAQEIISFSANNPKWIMLVTQTYSLVSIIMLASKFLR